MINNKRLAKSQRMGPLLAMYQWALAVKPLSWAQVEAPFLVARSNPRSHGSAQAGWAW